MSIHKQKASPYWYAVIYMDGRHQWISTKCKKKDDALAVHDEIKARYQVRQRSRKIAALLGEPLPEDNSLPIRKAWNIYKTLRPDAPAASMKYFIPFREWLIKYHPDCLDIAQVNKTIAVDYLYSKYQDKAPKTFNNVKSALSSIWTTLEIKADLNNPWIKIPNRAPDSLRYRAFTDQEIIKILKNTSGFWHYATIIGIYTGLRRKDITFLQWEQIKDDYIELIPSKTKRHARAVYVPLHEELKKLLKTIPKKGPYLFPKIIKQYDTGVYNEAFGKILQECKIENTNDGKASFHSLRSTFVTRCEEHGISRQIIQGIVGHNSPTMTKHYSDDKVSALQILTLTPL